MTFLTDQEKDTHLAHLDPDFPASSPETADAAVALARALRRFLDLAAATKADIGRVASLVTDLNQLSEGLAAASVPESEAIWRKAPRSEPTALIPAFSYYEDGERLEGTVRFGRFHVGRLAAHGGAISLLFDEILGALVISGGRSTARTAYLRVDFRSVVPLDTDMHISAWFSLEEGRKRFVRGQITNGDVICAEAEGLWVALRPGQI